MAKYIDADLLRKEIEVQRDLFIGHAAILKKTVATDGFDMSIIVKNKSIEDEYRYKYQLIFRFWDFEQFREGTGYSVDFVVMPCIDGRMDAICSNMANDLDNNIEFAEKFAKDYYEFVIKQIEK